MAVSVTADHLNSRIKSRGAQKLEDLDSMWGSEPEETTAAVEPEPGPEPKPKAKKQKKKPQKKAPPRRKILLTDEELFFDLFMGR